MAIRSNHYLNISYIVPKCKMKIFSSKMSIYLFLLLTKWRLSTKFSCMGTQIEECVQNPNSSFTLAIYDSSSYMLCNKSLSHLVVKLFFFFFYSPKSAPWAVSTHLCISWCDSKPGALSRALCKLAPSHLSVGLKDSESWVIDHQSL